MFTLEGINPRNHKDLEQLMAQIETRLKVLVPETPSYRTRSLTALHTWCVEPHIGAYVEKYGLDRICDWQYVGDEDLPDLEPLGITEKDIELLRTAAPQHLEKCPRCLAFSELYLGFARELLPVVKGVAQVSLNAKIKETPLSADKAAGLYAELVRLGYDVYITVDRMQRRLNIARQLGETPCTDTAFSGRYLLQGPTKYAAELLKTQFQLEREKSDLQYLTPEERIQDLRKVSDHKDACSHCCTRYTYEKEEEAFHKFFYALF